MWLGNALPERHLDAETKELIKLGVGLIGTMAALLLGLLVASAKSSYDTRSSEVSQLAANVILLDRALAHYGPEAGEARGILRTAIATMIAEVWSNDATESGLSGISGQGAGNVLYEKIQEVAPHSDAQHARQSQAESILVNIGQTRLLLFSQAGTSISTPFLVVVVFWLSTLFVS